MISRARNIKGAVGRGGGAHTGSVASTSMSRRLGPVLLLPLLAVTARAQLVPEWVGSVPVGSALGAGLQEAVTDAAGVTYVTGNGGPSLGSDVYTAAFAGDGTLLWQDVFDGPSHGADQGRGICLGPDGVVYVTGNTPGPFSIADVLLLKYDAASGALLDTVQFMSAAFTSEYGASVATDAVGNVFVGGATSGDGGDGLVVSFDPLGNPRWTATYDGPGASPFSNDQVEQVLVDADGDVFAMIIGVMGNGQPDYVVIKYAGVTGDVLWSTNWGANGGDYVTEIVLGANGDVFATGTTTDVIDKFGTIKLDGTDGHILWEAIDEIALDHRASGVALDAQGDVYVTGTSDPDGNASNNNDDFFTVKRDGTTGELEWVHSYGQACVSCLDGASDVIVDAAGHVLLVGGAGSPPYDHDLILFVLDGHTGFEMTRGVVDAPAGESVAGGFLGLDANAAVYVAGRHADLTSGDEDMLVLGFAGLGDWTDQGSGLAGTSAVTPTLAGSGALVPGTQVQLLLGNALAGTVTYLVLGALRLGAPFKGGVLVPQPDVVLPSLPVGGDGSLLLSFEWPAGIPTGASVFLQHWASDPGAPAGYSASNGLQGTTP